MTSLCSAPGDTVGDVTSQTDSIKVTLILTLLLIALLFILIISQIALPDGSTGQWVMSSGQGNYYSEIHLLASSQQSADGLITQQLSSRMVREN